MIIWSIQTVATVTPSKISVQKRAAPGTAKIPQDPQALVDLRDKGQVDKWANKQRFIRIRAVKWDRPTTGEGMYQVKTCKKNLLER